MELWSSGAMEQLCYEASEQELGTIFGGYEACKATHIYSNFCCGYFRAITLEHNTEQSDKAKAKTSHPPYHLIRIIKDVYPTSDPTDG